MAIIEKTGNPAGVINARDISADGQFSDEDALKLVVQDARTADSYLAQKMWPLRWKEIDVLYQSPRPLSTWENTTVAEANVTSFTVCKHVNSIVPRMVNGLFYEDPPFLLRPRPGTDQNVVRAKTAVFSAQLDEMHFQEQVEDGWFYTVLFGTAIYKWGWLSGHKIEKRYVRKAQPTKLPTEFGDVTVHTKESDEFEVKEIEKDTERPHFEHIDLRYVLVDPGCRVPDIRHAKWVIHRMYLTFTDLQDLRGQEGWDIPDDETLKSYFENPKEQTAMPGQIEYGTTPGIAHAAPRYANNTADPLQQVFKVEERWDRDKVIAVLQDKRVIRNEKNPVGKIPFYSSHFLRIPDSFYSLGVGMLVGQDQRVTQGLRNAALNLLALAVNPNYLRNRGANVPTQMIRQRRGGIIDVDVPTGQRLMDAFQILEVPKVPPEVFAVLQNSKAESESASGADELLVQGATQGGHTSMGRTAGGAAQLGAASAGRLDGPMTKFIKNVFEPWIYEMSELDNERLPASIIREILGDELGDDFAVDEEQFFNAKIEYEILAGTHLAAKRGMAQALPLISQIFENQALLQQLQQTGWTVDVRELFTMFLEISEWKNTRNIIRPLNDQEKQHMAQQNAPAAKVQGAAMLQDQKFQQNQVLNDQKNEAKATAEVLRQVLEKVELPEALEGEGGKVGFGSS